MPTDRALLHALAMEGVAPADAVAEAAGAPAEAVEAALADLAAEGLVEEADGVWYLTDAGDARLTERCRARFDDDGLAALRERHEAFEALDDRLKDLASEWQATGDPALVADLADLHADLETLFSDLDAEVRGAYEPYLRDLEAALSALEEGREAYFTGTEVDSYHEVWFDLHDDLLRTLGAGRHA